MSNKIIEFYKLHNPDWENFAEIHMFMKRFDLNPLIIKHPNPETETRLEQQRQEKVHKAKMWIIENSKIL